MSKRETTGLVGMIVGLLLVLQSQGLIDLSKIIPNDNPTPVIPTPAPTPDNPDNPDPVPPQPDVLIEIENENFPELPVYLAEVSKPIYDVFMQCKNPNGAIIVARAYADWSDYLLTNSASVIDTTEKYRNLNIQVLKAMLDKHELTTICPGLSKAIDSVIISQIGLDNRALDQTDRVKLSDAYQAISARAYEAFKKTVMP